MQIIRKINILLVEVALPRTQDATQDRPADIVVNVDEGLKEGAEGTTVPRRNAVQCACRFLSAEVRRIRSMVLLRITRKGICMLQSWLS